MEFVRVVSQFLTDYSQKRPFLKVVVHLMGHHAQRPGAEVTSLSRGVTRIWIAYDGELVL